MACLFQRIKERYPDVARVLEMERFCSDDDIRSLTLEDLRELLPGRRTLRQRKDVYELIHQQKPISEILKALKAFIPAESLTAALTENGVLVDYLRIMKDTATQAEKTHTFFLAHVSLLEEYINYQAGKGTHTGSDTQPGSNLTPRPTDSIATHTGSSAQQGSKLLITTGTHTESNVQQGSKTTGSWSGYLSSINPFSQGVKQDVSPGTDVDIASRPAIDPAPRPSDAESPTARDAQRISGAPSSVATWQISVNESVHMDIASRPAIDPAPRPSDAESPTARDAQRISGAPSSVATRQISVTENPPTVRFLSFVSGNTLGCEKTLLDRVRQQTNMTLVEDHSDPQIIIVFCPIVSRIESDLANAMAKPPASLGDKPVILVMMYHMHEPNEGVFQKPGSFLKRWNVVLDVNVFYHDGLHGLVPCETNTQAVADIGTALLKRSACESDGASGKSEVHRRDGGASDSFARAGSGDIGDVGAGGCDRNAGPGYGDYRCPGGSSRVKASHDDQRGSGVHRSSLTGGDEVKRVIYSRFDDQGLSAGLNNQVGSAGARTLQSRQQTANYGNAANYTSGHHDTTGQVDKSKKGKFFCKNS